MGAIILSAIVAHTGWHWMTERWAVLRQYHVEWPRFDVFFLLALTRWALAVVVLTALVWGVKILADRPSGRSAKMID